MTLFIHLHLLHPLYFVFPISFLQSTLMSLVYSVAVLLYLLYNPIYRRTDSSWCEWLGGSKERGLGGWWGLLFCTVICLWTFSVTELGDYFWLIDVIFDRGEFKFGHTNKFPKVKKLSKGVFNRSKVIPDQILFLSSENPPWCVEYFILLPKSAYPSYLLTLCQIRMVWRRLKLYLSCYHPPTVVVASSYHSDTCYLCDMVCITGTDWQAGLCSAFNYESYIC